MHKQEITITTYLVYWPHRLLKLECKCLKVQRRSENSSASTCTRLYFGETEVIHD